VKVCDVDKVFLSEFSREGIVQNQGAPLRDIDYTLNRIRRFSPIARVLTDHASKADYTPRPNLFRDRLSDVSKSYLQKGDITDLEFGVFLDHLCLAQSGRLVPGLGLILPLSTFALVTASVAGRGLVSSA